MSKECRASDVMEGGEGYFTSVLNTSLQMWPLFFFYSDSVDDMHYCVLT